MRICDAIDAAVWAMDEAWVLRLRAIAVGEGESPEAVAARLGRPLQNAQLATVRDGVAILPIAGPIFRYANLFTAVSGATSIEIFARDLRTALDDPAVKAILLEINSPGGQVDGTNEAAGMIAAADKPVIAYVSSLGLSAAYWLASAADEIVVDATAQLGSIGVVGMIDGRKRDDGSVEFVSSQSPNKRPDISTPEGRATVQARVDAIADVFVDAVAQNRGVSRETVLGDFGAGGVKVGAQAMDAGMADSVGSLETTLALLAGGYDPRRKGKRMSTKADEKTLTMTEEHLASLVDKARGESKAETLKDLEAAKTAAREEGVKSERDRITGIDRITVPGQGELAGKAKADGMSVADFAIKQSEAEKATRERQLDARKGDDVALRTGGLPAPSASATGERTAPATDPNLPLDERCKAKWAADPKLAEEFVDFASYLAFERANSSNKVRILGSKRA